MNDVISMKTYTQFTAIALDDKQIFTFGGMIGNTIDCEDGHSYDCIWNNVQNEVYYMSTSSGKWNVHRK